MGRRKITFILALVMLINLSLSARRLTTTQMRNNTIRINAMELKEINVIPKTVQAPEEPIREVPKEMTIVLDSRALNFDFDKYNVKEMYYELLENLKEYVLSNNYDVTIIGHTDYMGSDSYNIALGQRRADSVKRKLIEFGLPSDRILGTQSRGEREPIATNSTSEGRAQNRRIEFKLVRRD